MQAAASLYQNMDQEDIMKAMMGELVVVCLICLVECHLACLME
jgi:hypothetical protein